MDYDRRSNGLMTFLEHWWFLGIPFIGILASELFSFFSRLTGIRWLWCYGVALVLAGLGVSLIFCAKLPLYRKRRFFTFGCGALPESRRPAYRWGYRCALFAVALFLGLLLSRP